MNRKATLTGLFLILASVVFCATVEPFWDQNFESGFPSNWETGDLSGQGVMWQFCDNPSFCPPQTILALQCRDKTFHSPSFEDGYMFVNGSVNTNPQGNFVSYLRTAPINCSSKPSVFIRFSTFLAGQYLDPDTSAVLRVKNDVGLWQTFTLFPFLNFETSQNLMSWNPQEILIDISSAAANQSNVQIEWRWTGFFESSWHIDDVELFDGNPLYDNAVWGAVPGQGDFLGGLNGWTVPQPSLDICAWEWQLEPLIFFPDGDSLANAIGCSPTLHNGSMVMNASFCNAPGGGTPSPYSKSELHSPPIDLSAVPAGTRLSLQFSQAVATGNVAEDQLPVTSVLVSVNGGQTYLDTIDANPNLPFSRGFCGMTRLDLPIGLAGSEDVRIKFVFSGDTFFWIIDDVSIIRNYDADVRINPAYFSVSPDHSVPVSAVSPVWFHAEVENAGLETLNDVTMFATVKNAETQQTVFRDTLDLGTLLPGEILSNVIFSKQFLPPPIPARYNCSYWVAADEPDQDFSNNLVRWEYEVTESIYSKALDLCDVNGYFAPNEDLIYEIGNCFYIPSGNELAATSVSFAFKSAPALGAHNAVLQTALYRWKTDTTEADVNMDTIANANEFELVGINQYEVKTSDNNKIIHVPIDFEEDQIPLEEDTYYFVTVGYLNPVFNGIGAPIPFFIGGSEEIDYTSTFWLSYQYERPAYVSMLRLGSDDFFRANAWALRRIPFVRLHVSQLNETKTRPAQTVEIEVFPNPAQELIYLSADFGTLPGLATVQIFDNRGRLAATRQFENAIVSQLPIDVGFLSNGSYTLRVISGEKTGTAKLLILK